MAVSYVQSSDLTEEEQRTINGLLAELRQKNERNALRTQYYEGKRRLTALGLSIPPEMRDLETVVQWPEKVCTTLASRLKFEGLVIPGQSEADRELENIFEDNEFSLQLPQTITSVFQHGCAFVSVLAGEEGEPPVVIQTMDATEATGLYDARRRRLKAAIWAPADERITGSNRFLQKVQLFTTDSIITLTREAGESEWNVDRVGHILGVVPVVPLTHRANLKRPFGSSRITRSVMSRTDMAVRTLLRLEVTAEFFSAPQRYVLGADQNAFQDNEGRPLPGWEMLMGRVLGLEANEDGEKPTVGQFPQASMEPHVAMLRAIATMFAGENGMPVSETGVIHDQPASAEAIDAAWTSTVALAEDSQIEIGARLARVGQLAHMIMNDTSVLPEDFRRLRAKWRDPSIPTRAAQTAWVTQQINSGVLLPYSTVALEGLGYSTVDIERIQAEHRQAQNQSVLQGLNETAKQSRAVLAQAGVPVRQDRAATREAENAQRAMNS